MARRQWVLLQLWYCCLGAWLSLAQADLSRYCTQGQYWTRPTLGICGSNLSAVLSLLCGTSGYPTIHKRSTAAVKQQLAAEDGMFLQKDKALALLRVRRSSDRSWTSNAEQGIVCECCQHRCSARELLEYCAGAPNTRLGLAVGASAGGRRPTTLPPTTTSTTSTTPYQSTIPATKKRPSRLADRTAARPADTAADSDTGSRAPAAGARGGARRLRLRKRPQRKYYKSSADFISRKRKKWSFKPKRSDKKYKSNFGS